MSDNKFNDLYKQIDEMANFFMRYMGSLGVQEITIDSRLFDQIADHSMRHRLWIDAAETRPKSEKDLPLQSMTINALGRPVVIKRGK